MITRPKSLLIVIGDHNALCNDQSWKYLFKYCEQNGATLCNDRKMHQRIMWDK